ncbi:CHAT domain-containing protein [Hamadaea tsunoensis]|uniref:CHAT domain-containing protein n=1 Tax=Hamadaea tsunoensis TaxID=53368 RepID=UPI000416E3B1|nr:CHAT domain-containing protein [Hamadaea tsunoensis]
MDRVVLRVSTTPPLQDPLPHILFSLEYPPGIGGDQRLDLTPLQPMINAYLTGALAADGVRQLGRHLFDALMQQPEVAAAFNAAILADRCPVYVYVRGLGIPETLPWEALWNATARFLSLDERWPISRMMPTAQNVVTSDIYRPPPRILAVLSCLDVSARNQWEEIWKGVQASPVGVFAEIKVLTSEPELRRHIEDLGDPRVSAELLHSQRQLEDVAQRFRPHVLHFFSHGTAEPVPQLLLATASDRAAGLPETIVLESQQVKAMCSPDEPPLLVVLNCCKGGQPGGDTLSLAGDLVYQRGFPAVMGMREQILAESADTLAGALYPEIMAIFDELRTPGATRAVLDWSRLIVAPRIRLCQAQQGPGAGFSTAAANTKEWTVPVLYVRPTACEVNLEAEAASQTDQLSLQLLRGMLAAAGPGTPDSWRETLIAHIARIEAEVAP